MNNKFLMAAMLTVVSVNVIAAEEKKPEVAPVPVKVMTGKELAFDSSKGNCLACHAMPGVPDAKMAGNIAPALISMQARFPDKRKIKDRITDPTLINPNTVMPPFGRNKLLTDEEIDKVTDFIQSL